MKILLASNAPWASTGHGTQTASLARRLRDAGHHVVIYCNYGLMGGVQQWEGIMCLPGNGEGYTDPIIKGHIRYVQPDLLLTLHDIWPFAQHQDLMAFIQQQSCRWAAWFPIDALPVSKANLLALAAVDYPITMAQFAQNALAEVGAKTTYIPHGIEKSFGYTANGRREFRRHLQVPDDAFLFGSVGRNSYYPGRKGHDRLMRAFSEMPDDCYLYIHALTNSENGSIPLPKVAEFYGVQDRVMFADDYNGVMGYSQTGMNSLYSAMDCYVQPTLGEGFGIPVLEAQACGCAVIATDCTSMPELCAPNSSELIPGATEIMVPDPSHRVLIDIPKLTEAMKEIYRLKKEDPGFLAMKGTAGLFANNYDWDRVWAEAWVPFLAEVEAEIALVPRKEWHRGGSLVFEHEGKMRKQDSTLRSPAASKELAFLREFAEVDGIIPVLGDGVTPDGMVWFDMPLLTPLRDVDLDTLTPEQKSRIKDGVRRALTALHEKGRAHRDVCPENVVVDAEYNPYLIDFEWAHPCDGEIGKDCVDFEPWDCLERAVMVVQVGMAERGFHTIVQHIDGFDLSQKTHGHKGVPYQQVDGVGERDCQLRWDIMQPDVAGKTVLDIGSNLGWFCRKACEEGAEKATGVENDLAVVNAAKAMTNGHNIEYIAQDLMAWEPKEKYDVGLALSVLQHLPDPDIVMDRLVQSCKEVYVEIPSRFITQRMADYLKDAKMLGESERGRPIYKVTA